MWPEKIMGIPVDAISYVDIINDLNRYFESDTQMRVTSINPQIVLEAHKYPEIIKYIKQSTHRIPDGIGIVMVSKFTNGKIKERVAGFDLMVKFLEYADKHKKKCFFYGAQPKVLLDTLKNVKKKYPNLIIAGSLDGYVNISDEKITKKINQADTDFLFVAMGFPLQEQWLSRNSAKLTANVLQDVGGSFDVLSGHVKRAPKIFITLHLEWLYRSLMDRKRMYRITQLPIFFIKSLIWYKKNLKKRNFD